MRWITYSASKIIVLPLKLAYCIFMLYYMTGWYFLYAIVIFYLTKRVTEYFKDYNEKVEKEISKIRDEKAKLTTEVINNIKLLKLYSWTEMFKKRIEKFIDDEIGVQWK
jgi:ABC-type bacteriocin/lantibiotic exporter with double-glycine peptidase domain